MVAAADAIWVENGGQVLRVQMADLESGSFKAIDLSAMAEGGRR